MNNFTKIILAVIAAVVIYFVLVKGPEQANSTRRSAGSGSSSRRPSIFDAENSGTTPSNTPSRGNSTNSGTTTNTPTGTSTRPATPGNMNDREIKPSTTSRNGRFTTISLQEESDRVISDSRGTTTTSSSTSGSRTQGTSTRGTSTRGSSTTGTRITSGTSSRTSGTGTNPRRVSRQYYPLQ